MDDVETLDAEVVPVTELGRRVLPAPSIDDDQPLASLVLVDLDRKAHGREVDAALDALAAAPGTLAVGVSRRVVAPGMDRLADALTCVVGDGAPSTATAVVPDLADVLRDIAGTVSANPRAAVTLDGLLRVTERSGLSQGLQAEALAYSTLLAGPEFARWCADHPEPARKNVPDPAVVVDRDGNRLVIEIDRPQHHNAFSREVRDGLCDALDIALADRSIAQLVISGRGDSFCSGGVIDEPEPLPVRLERSVGARLDRLRARVTVEVHGACIGAGAELPAFAGRVIAARDSFFRLPEISMGLVPGNGGTVSLTRRIGRSRTAFLALTGRGVDAATARDWGLVDSLAGGRR